MTSDHVHDVADHRALEYLDMVRRIGAPWLRSAGEFSDDLQSEGTLALLLCSRRFDASNGASFKTFAYRRVRGAMQDTYRLSRLMGRQRGERMRRSPVSVLEQIRSFGIAPDLRVHTRELIQSLPLRLRAVVMWHYFADVDLADVALRLGLTPSRVSQLHKEAIRQMRRVAGIHNG